MPASARILRWLLVLASCGLSAAGVAQRAAVPPLAPRPPASQVTPPRIEATPIAGESGAPPDATPRFAPLSAPRVLAPEPLYLLGGELIINGTMFSTINPQHIKDVKIYKGRDAPRQWRDLATLGIINITLKEKKEVESQTFAALAKRVGVSGPVQYTLNGMPINTDARLRIAHEAVGEVTIVSATPATTVTTVAIRLRQAAPRPPCYTPLGTIYIRGATR
ncbi:hypothetical protein ACW9KT_18940 [Hymenobacter sp. HD11105]